jgi:hypothetical protein
VGVRHAIGLAVLASVLLVGCYGETQPATDLRPNFARLHGQFTANNGPASSWFEYWATSDPDHKWQTAERDWAAGESGPVEADAPVLIGGPESRLRDGTSDSFHLCGRDGTDTRNPSGCAQTQTFTTPVGDGVEGAFAEGFRFVEPQFTFRASSGPAGENVEGSLHERGFSEFNGFASCFAIHGERAAVGAVGYRRSTQGLDTDWHPATELLSFDTSPPGQDTYHVVITPGTLTPPDCASASFDNLEPPDFIGVGFIQDAPPAG